MQSDLSGITGSTEQERFYNKWEKIIASGLREDFSQLNPMAVWMLPKDDLGLKTVARLKRELGDIQTKLPQRDMLAKQI